MKSLTEIYNAGICTIPKAGRYAVQIRIGGIWRKILEKKIQDCRGTNHLPVFFWRQFSISIMTFKIDTAQEEVLFIYDNGLIIDKLRYVGGKWLGKLFYRNKQIDWFFLIPFH